MEAQSRTHRLQPITKTHEPPLALAQCVVNYKGDGPLPFAYDDVFIARMVVKLKTAFFGDQFATL